MKENDIGNYLDMSKAKMLEAVDVLDEAKLLFENQRYLGTANRLYYSIFKAISAIHNLDGNKFKSHKDALGQFNKLYIHNDVFPKEYASKIYKIQEIRQEADYSARPKLKKEMLEEYLTFTIEFVDTLKTYCNNRLQPSLEQFTNIYNSFREDEKICNNSNIALNFMKSIVKNYGIDTQILKKAIEAVINIENESPQFAAKLMNDTLKTDEYKNAFEANQTKVAENTR